jgi:hypothetical protein
MVLRLSKMTFKTPAHFQSEKALERTAAKGR